jgi:phosphoribosylformylglycinamidine synthase
VDKPWVYSAFVDNAGIIRFDETYDLAFKVETHNRPTAIEPFGGANTGIGGVIRDVLGVSARPIANTDVLCFGPPDLPSEQLPEAVLHPRRIAEGVISGIEDYGNKMGIPTINGAIIYHNGYTANPLVFCGCLGILPHNSHRSEAQPGDLIVVIGGRTGRDGLRGATFSSMEMDSTTSTVSGSAVQIGHPINEKQVQEVVLRARDERLYTAITDCGAGGLSSAVGEMGEKVGATVQLETVPLKYPGLRPWEIWLSEAQERMVMAVPQKNWPRVKEISAGQDVEAVAIGTFDPTGRLTLHYNDTFVGDISMEFLHDGIPQKQLQAHWSPPTGVAAEKPFHPRPVDLTDKLLRLLAMPTIRSKEEVIRRYDHEVQGSTSVKPLVGVDNHGPSDAAVIVPHDTQNNSMPVRAIAISNGIAPIYTEFDPYAMAWAAIDEAMRNLVAVGADPDRWPFWTTSAGATPVCQTGLAPWCVAHRAAMTQQ